MLRDAIQKILENEQEFKRVVQPLYEWMLKLKILNHPPKVTIFIALMELLDGNNHVVLAFEDVYGQVWIPKSIKNVVFRNNYEPSNNPHIQLETLESVADLPNLMGPITELIGNGVITGEKIMIQLIDWYTQRLDIIQQSSSDIEAISKAQKLKFSIYELDGLTYTLDNINKHDNPRVVNKYKQLIYLMESKTNNFDVHITLADFKHMYELLLQQCNKAKKKLNNTVYKNRYGGV